MPRQAEFNLARAPTPGEQADMTWFIRYVFAAMTGIMVGLALWFVVTIPFSVLFLTPEIVVIVVVSLFACAAAYGFLGLGRGADFCSLDENGFTLRYRHGRDRRFDWSDSRLHLTLVEWDPLGQPLYEIRTRIPVRNEIPGHLYRELLAQAQSRGLTVSTRVGRGPDSAAVTTHVTARR